MNILYGRVWVKCLCERRVVCENNGAEVTCWYCGTRIKVTDMKAVCNSSHVTDWIADIVAAEEAK